MRIVAALLVLVLGSSCVTGRHTSRGDLIRTSVLSTEVEDGPPDTRVSGEVAKVYFTRTTCKAVKREYPTLSYERVSYPSQLIALLGAVAFGGALTLALTSAEPTFLWPEGKPAINYVGIGLAAATGAASVLAGWFPWLITNEPRIEKEFMVKSVNDGVHDTVENECSNETYYRSKALSWSLTAANGQTATGVTTDSGALNLGAPAVQTLLKTRVDEQGYKRALSSKGVTVEVKLGDAPTVDALVPLKCLDRNPEPVMLSCKLRCADAGEARCEPQYQRCMERVEDGRESLCVTKFEGCLVDRMVNKPAFETCYLDCLNKDLTDTCR